MIFQLVKGNLRMKNASKQMVRFNGSDDVFDFLFRDISKIVILDFIVDPNSGSGSS